MHRVPMGAIASNTSDGMVTSTTLNDHSPGASSILLATHPFNIDEEEKIIFAGSGGHPHPVDAVSSRKTHLRLIDT